MFKFLKEQNKIFLFLNINCSENEYQNTNKKMNARMKTNTTNNGPIFSFRNWWPPTGRPISRIGDLCYEQESNY